MISVQFNFQQIITTSLEQWQSSFKSGKSLDPLATNVRIFWRGHLPSVTLTDFLLDLNQGSVQARHFGFWKQFYTRSDVCFEPLLCWRTKFRPKPNLASDYDKFSTEIFSYSSFLWFLPMVGVSGLSLMIKGALENRWFVENVVYTKMLQT